MRVKLIFFLAVILSASCTGASNLRLNEELTNLYVAKQDSRDSADVILEQTFVDAFASLAARAESAARSSSNTADAVSFYRIAATAAWQGNAENVEDLSNSGWARCNEKGFDKARRDCVMLLVIPDLAAAEELSRGLDEVRDQVDETRRNAEDGESTASLAELSSAIDDIFKSLNARFEVLEAAQIDFEDKSLPPGLMAQLARNQNFIFCRMTDANGVLLRGAGTNDRRFIDNQATLSAILQARDEGTDMTCPHPQ